MKADDSWCAARGDSNLRRIAGVSEAGDCSRIPSGARDLYCKSFVRVLVRPERFELPACCFGGNRSIQLSYGRTRDADLDRVSFPRADAKPDRPVWSSV